MLQHYATGTKTQCTWSVKGKRMPLLWKKKYIKPLCSSYTELYLNFLKVVPEGDILEATHFKNRMWSLLLLRPSSHAEIADLKATSKVSWFDCSKRGKINSRLQNTSKQKQTGESLTQASFTRTLHSLKPHRNFNPNSDNTASSQQHSGSFLIMPLDFYRTASNSQEVFSCFKMVSFFQVCLL